ncbi:MAG: Na+/H+ antiporter [Lapillicoccus sp.]
MSTLLLVVVLVVGVVVLTPVADRIGVPQPVVLTIFGLLLALLPFTPTVAFDPALVLPAVLPPLLFAATQRTTVREFRDHAGAVVVLAVGLTLATAVVVAIVAHALGVPWAAAFVLGAIVSPPDPVAATAVARRLRLPHRLVTILEGEGMFNDATALVAFKVTLAAALTGGFSWGGTAIEMVLAVVVGVAVGLALGWLTTRALAALHDGYAETTVTLLVPFLAYVGAEHLRGSGVLAVLVLGLYLLTFSHPATTSAGWLLGRSVWGYVDFLVTSLVFAVLGFELVKVIETSSLGPDTIRLAAAVAGTLIAFRALWVFPTAALARLRSRRRDAPLPSNWRETLVVSWAGMRGVVTVAGALSIPLVTESGADFPRRSDVVVVALVCVLVTLVLQGLTLAPLTKRLGVGGAAGHERNELPDLRRRAAEHALRHVRHAIENDPSPVAEPIRHAVVEHYEGLIASQEALHEVRAAEVGEGRDPAAQLAAWMGQATSSERDYVLDQRRRGLVTPESADEALREIEGRSLRASR